ncbi:IFM1 [Candida pseudojiufengensis]|uniref:IFM1 n=1 Tax=Candida pseudojiufengensis TaxID=497109 RepID=UPI002224EB57|nr:IFM1 [Candida pseudojiufengensis]KAI5959869.1 IFM1 [Candida pseudojiufengensis]
MFHISSRSCLKRILLTRTYSDILNDIRRVANSKPTSKPSTISNSDKPKINRFAQQYSKPKPQISNNRPARPNISNRNGNYGNSRRPHLQNRDSNNSINKQFTPLNGPQLTKEEIERQKLIKYQELRRQIEKGDTKDQQHRDNETFIPQRTTKSRKFRKLKERKKPIVKIQLPPFISIANLAMIMQVPINDVIKKTQDLGFENVRHSYILDKENASLIADEYDIEVEIISDNNKKNENDLFSDPIKPENLKERPPVVTIMGHVDHGKTTILDYLRNSSIVKGEFGGITQHIGAFSVITPESKKKITFLDTPGHAAFLKMRERGAIITDIIILVVAADDSVMPQTIEAIKHAKKAGAPIIIAINKCDKPGIKIDKVLSDLSSHNIDIEDYGGDTQVVQVSGKTGLNMNKLEEAIITLSELQEFKSEFNGIASEGWIIESEVIKGMGNVATVLVRRGSLKNGDIIVAGKTYCKIKGMKDENGKILKLAEPSTPVQIWGWKGLPDSGDHIIQAKTEQIAKKVIEFRQKRSQEIQASRDIENINLKRSEEIKEAERLEKLTELKKAGLDSSELEIKEEDKQVKCNYIIKSDVFGSSEAIKESIDGLGNDEVKSIVISNSAGLPTDNDLDMAKTFGATIFCFNLKIPKPILIRAEKEKIKIIEHNIIYRLIEQVNDELNSHLKPRIETKILGEVELKDIFTITQGKSKIKIAGCKVLSGIIKRSSNVKVLRQKKEIYKGTLSSLKHIKDDITEARKGNECGLSFSNWNGFEAGDLIQVYEEIEHKRYL